jgi:hypothetical protein
MPEKLAWNSRKAGIWGKPCKTFAVQFASSNAELYEIVLEFGTILFGSLA